MDGIRSVSETKVNAKPIAVANVSADAKVSANAKSPM